jgi:hypothetical protein
MWYIDADRARDIIAQRQREAQNARLGRLAAQRAPRERGPVGRARARLTAATAGAVGR